MTQVMACIDGSLSSQSVCDYATWASKQMKGKPPAQPPLLGGCSQRQQLIQPAIRSGWQLLQRVFRPRTRLDTVQFGYRQQTLDRRRTPTRAL